MKKKSNIFVECHDKDGNIKKVPTSEVSFRPSTYGMLIEGGKILLAHTWNGYDLPGGGIEKHETIIDALQREFLEETGIKVEPVGLVTCKTSFFIMPKDKSKKNCQLIYYVVKKISGTLTQEACDDDDHILPPEWIALADINKVTFNNSVDSVRIIKRAINKEYAPL